MTISETVKYDGSGGSYTLHMNQNDRAVVLFTCISHGTLHTFELSIPILVVIWLLEFPVSTATLGTAVAVGYGLYGLGALPGGILADRYGSRRLIVGSQVCMVLAFLVLSFADGIVTIAGALALWGVGASVYHPSGLSLISTSVEDRGAAFAYHGMAGNIGIAFGPLLTALLLVVFDWRIASRVLVLPAMAAILFALQSEFDERVAASADGGRSPTSLSAFVAKSRLLFTAGFTVAMLVVMMNGLFYRASLTFLPEVLSGFLPDVTAFVQLFDPESPLAEEFDLASYLYVGLLVIGIFGQYVGGKVSDKVDPRTVLAVVFSGLAVVTVGFAPAARLGTAPLFVVSGLLGFLLFALQPLYQTVIAEESPPEARGLSYGYTYLTNFGVGAGGAVLSGYLLSVASVGDTFLILAVLPVLGAALALGLRRLPNAV